MTDKIVIGEFANFLERLPGVFKALAVGIPAGYIFDLLDTPIPWMIGPMIAVATLNLMGVRMHSPPYARHLGQVILGSAVSLYFTPSVVAALAGNFPAIVAATVAVFLIGALGALMLSQFPVLNENRPSSLQFQAAQWRWRFWPSAMGLRSRRWRSLTACAFRWLLS